MMRCLKGVVFWQFLPSLPVDIHAEKGYPDIQFPLEAPGSLIGDEVRMKFSMGQTISAVFGLALLILSVVGVVAYQAMTHFALEAGRVEQSWRVLKELGDVSNRLLTAELRQRNYLLSRDESELEMSHAAAGAITRELEDLRQLTRDNPTHQQRLTALASLVAKAEAERQKT